jgi:hypothetical protein
MRILIQSTASACARAIREAAWLMADRATAAAWLLLIQLLAVTALVPWIVPDLRLGYDFATFWIAAKFALSGHAPDAYGVPGQEAMAAMFGPGRHPPFFYPPTALLLWAPFALLPFAPAAWLWLGAIGTAYAACMRALLGSRLVILALAFPAVFVGALLGQTSMLVAALFGGAALTLDRSPRLAGVLIGCLVFKPQLAVLAPVALAVAGRWQAFIAAAVTAVILVLASVVASWSAFFAVLPSVKSWNGGADTHFDLFASVYAAARLLHLPDPTAGIVQALATIAATVLLWMVARRRPGGAAEISLLVVATGFCVPFLGDYDLLIFVVPGIWLGCEAARTGWLPYERVGLACLFLAPLVIKLAAQLLGLPLSPVALALLAALVVRRLRRAPSISA